MFFMVPIAIVIVWITYMQYAASCVAIRSFYFFHNIVHTRSHQLELVSLFKYSRTQVCALALFPVPSDFFPIFSRGQGNKANVHANQLQHKPP